ncbi:MAG: MFS transporter [Actinomycetes bacterium]
MTGRARVVLLTSLLGRLPQGMAPLAALLLVQQRTGSIAAAGLATGAWGLGSALGQTTWGRLAGRGRAHRVVTVAAVTQALLITVLALVPTDAATLLVTLAGLGGLAAPPISPVARTLWPDLATTEVELGAMYTLDATTQEVVFIAGPALVGAVIGIASASAALLTTAVLGGVGGLVFARVVRPLWRPHPHPGGGRALLSVMALPWAVMAVMALGLGLTEVAVSAAAIIDGQRKVAGVLLAVWSLGSLVGGLATSRRVWRSTPVVRLAPLFGTLAAGTAVVAAVWSVGIIVLGVALFASGLALAPSLAALYAVVGESAPAGRRTDAFAVGTTSLLLGLSGGAALGGLLSAVTPTLAFVSAVAVFAAASASSLVLRRRGQGVSGPG